MASVEGVRIAAQPGNASAQLVGSWVSMEKIAPPVLKRQRWYVPQLALISRVRENFGAETEFFDAILFLIIFLIVSDCVVGDNTVELIEGTCKAVKSQNGTQHLLATALNQCGTSALHKGDCIMFSVKRHFT